MNRNIRANKVSN